MYCNLTRSQGFPMAIRVSLQQSKVKSFKTSNSNYLPSGFCVNPKVNTFADLSSDKRFSLLNQRSVLVSSSVKSMEIGMLGKLENRLKIRNCKEFSSFGLQKFGKRKPFRGIKASEKRNNGVNGGFSWNVSAKKFEKSNEVSIWVKSDVKPEEERSQTSWENQDSVSERKSSYRTQDESRNRNPFRRAQEEDEITESPAKEQFLRPNQSSWKKQDGENDLNSDRRSRYRTQDELRNRNPFRRGQEEDKITEKEQFLRPNQSIWKKQDGENDLNFDKRSRNRTQDESRNRNSFRNERIIEEDEENEELEEELEDTRWSEIKTRFNRINVRDNQRRDDNNPPAYRNWNKQETWGKKTWQEATESSIPKLIGEVLYGVSPVLAALSVNRREFYALYIQEGHDSNTNNNKKKKKYRKSFEKVLKLAEELGLTIKEASKHDLNMVTDNRPHQGLVLDASPLELVKVKELDSITSTEEKSSVWLALDEVTDPQNLGAIIRSAYFFGATGIVVCAKNSAPLSAVVSKASAGSLEVMELRYCKNMMQFLTGSSENGWRVIGGSMSSKAVSLDRVLVGEPTILVLGNEGTGLRPLVERSCTELVRISGNVSGESRESRESGESGDVVEFEVGDFVAVESLNVSVAAGLFLHHLLGKRSN